MTNGVIDCPGHPSPARQNIFEFTDGELQIIQWAISHWIECSLIEHSEEECAELYAYSARNKLTKQKDFINGTGL